MQRILFFLLLAVVLQACGTTKPIEVIDLELRDLDTLFVQAEKPSDLKTPDDFKLPRYQASPKRQFDLLHTDLELSFDWQAEKVIGVATLDLKPYFLPQNLLTLDAKDFVIKSVTRDGQALSYDYDNAQIQIDLGAPVDQTFRIQIRYEATPATTGGSAAITSDQGLFFINAQNEDPGKPQQIWTQGETEWNSRWFPTIDKPNERCTQSLKVRVDDRFTTLSNGLLKNQIPHDDGTRTDHWELSLPHAPYLFMLAVGEFAKVQEQWQGTPVEYYVEPEYEKDAKVIFNHTPEMLQFFSDKLQYPYPWPKFSQIIVRDYVSGAMENTTAVIYGDFVQKRRRDLIDNSNDYIVAHELIHHWFGDLVTCESWSNLTMNEGFANYGEYLWFEYKYGADEANYHLLNERSGYLYSSAGNNVHPLIHFAVRDKEDMFDSHSYNKGGAVLHMLRKEVGDQAFWQALHIYLKDNAYQAVEAHDLRLAFEKVSGQDLNWFFNQWYFASGHPNLNITYSYDTAQAEAVVLVEQTQNPSVAPPIFQATVEVDIYEKGEVRREKVWMNQRLQEFRFAAEQQPDLVTFDADYTLLGNLEDNKSSEALAFQFKEAPHYMDRHIALNELVDQESALLADILPLALNDPHWTIRQIALEELSFELAEELQTTLREKVLSDPHSKVRATALLRLNRTNDSQLLDISKQVIAQDSANNVVGAAIQVINQLDKELAHTYVKDLENVESQTLLLSIASIYSNADNLDNLVFFENRLQNFDGYAATSFYTHYQKLAAKGELGIGMSAMLKLYNLAMDAKESQWRKFAATKGLTDMANEWQSKANRLAKRNATRIAINKEVDVLSKLFEDIKAAEQNPQLQKLYRQIGIIERTN